MTVSICLSGVNTWISNNTDRYACRDDRGAFWYGYLDLGGCLAGVTICYIQCLRRSLDFARDHFGEPIPGFDLVYVWI